MSGLEGMDETKCVAKLARLITEAPAEDSAEQGEDDQEQGRKHEKLGGPGHQQGDAGHDLGAPQEHQC